MQLTRQTDFAFRSLIYLAQLPEGEFGHIKDICAYYDISPNHLSKIVVKLSRLGYIEAVRGKGGGIRLARAADDINLAEIAAAFETTMHPVNCTKPRCRIITFCKLKSVLDEAMQAFITSLGEYSLADVVTGKKIAILK